MTAFTPAPVKPVVSLSVVESLDIRVGTILKQERANPRELIGRQALFIVNLEPRRMAGDVSEGMVLDVGYADGLLPVLSTPERPVPDGARAG